MAESFLNKNDFVAMSTDIQLRNVTTDYIVTTFGRFSKGILLEEYSDKKTPVHMLEMEHDRIVLSAPNFSGAKGHILELSFTLFNGSKELMNFSLLCKITHSETSSENLSRIEAHIDKNHQAVWNEYIKGVSERQLEIETFFSKVKGI